MEKEIKFLKEWIVRYLKNKDLLARKIVSIDEFENGFEVKRKDKEQKFLIAPNLSQFDKILNEINSFSKGKALVCFHTKQNFDVLISNWNKFVDIGREFTVYFVNPFSKTEKVLILNPYTHELISDESSLKQGLKTMAENVEFTNEDEIKKIINS